MIAKPLLFALEWMHKYIPNYGWAIVVFTLALTMALIPIRIWTFHSARRMQMVAPEMKSIQDKYKKYSMSDPRKRKMNEEVMAVYQREGINPLGSCLPMLVQIPVIWAFYRMLNGAIALRHAPWIFWIHDLSAKDPYYVLPILMVITSYFMTKMTPTPTAAADPAQQKMMMLMPVFMGFIFFNLSSGLNLYYFTSNLIGVVQQWYLNKYATAAVAEQIQGQEKRMSEQRGSFPHRNQSRPARREQPPRDIPFDREHAAAELKRFVDLVVGEMQLEIEYEIVRTEGGPDGDALVVAFRGADQDFLLERNAELLLALEHVAHRWLKLNPQLHDRVRFDCGDYRATRLEELKLSARVAAQRVRETGQEFRFNPMSSRERRIVHLELNGAPGVRTMSEGSGDRRQLVIYPATPPARKGPR